jgi:hypothetical protein
LTALEEALDTQPWSAIAYHPDEAAKHLPAALLTAEQAHRWHMGQSVESEVRSAGVHRVYDEAERWLGMGVVDAATRRIKPVKVISQS